MEENRRSEIRLPGRIISPGITRGQACMEDLDREVPRRRITPEEVDEELDRLEQAREGLRANLREHILLAHTGADEDMENILRFHEMMLGDEEFFSRIRADIRGNGKNTEWAILDQSLAVIARFEAMADPYFQARAEDVRDLGESLLKILLQEEGERESSCSGAPPILVSRGLYATSAARARRFEAVGYLTESPAFSSHGAILLKGMGIPVLGGVRDLYSIVREGDELILDALAGEVIIRPTPATKEKYDALQKEWASAPVPTPRPSPPLETRDGVPVHLFANIEHPSQAPLVLRHGLEGIGLFRTEFLALERNRIPDEEEQIEVYRSIVDRLAGLPVVIRTLDIGADKQTVSLHRCTGRNPAMGIRGIRRHLMREPDELRTQLRAILRACAEAETASILFPMVTNLADIRAAKAFVEEVRQELARRALPHAGGVRIGAMLEVPSAVFLLGEILDEVQFISIGTNDLLQYFTASDRDNPSVLSYQDAREVSFLRLLDYVAGLAAERNRLDDLFVCGEIASSPEMVPLLIACGFRAFSVSPVVADAIREAVRATSSATVPEALHRDP